MKRLWLLVGASILGYLAVAMADPGANPFSIVNSGTGCPVSCFRADPVCGTDGNTYWCGSKDAECNGVQIAHSGYCVVENGGTGRGVMAGQALLLVHIVWLIFAGVLILFGFDT